MRNKVSLIDFSDGVLRDSAWMSSQPNGTTAPVLQPRWTNSLGAQNELAIIPGGGRNGKNCLRVASLPLANGVDAYAHPDFWLISRTNLLSRPKNDGMYLKPRNGKRVNRLSIWVKFSDGYRVPSSSIAYDGSANTARNFHIGTYHADPGRVDGVTDANDETWGWHFYHYLHIRHDVGNGGWINIVANQYPNHQREFSGATVSNPTAVATDYWDSCTALYFAPVPYIWDSGINYPPGMEIPHPAYMYIDEISMYWEDEIKPVEITSPGLPEGQAIRVTAGVQIDIPIRITNVTNASVTGKFRYRLKEYTTTSASLIDVLTSTNVNGKNVTLSAGQTKDYIFRITPNPAAYGSSPYSFALTSGIMFLPLSEEIVGTGSSLNRFKSKADPAIESTYTYTGLWGSDYTICVLNIPFEVNYAIADNPPIGKGGVYYSCGINSSRSGVLPGSSAYGRSLTYSLVQQDSSASGVLSLASNGAYTFTPATGYTGKHFFRYKVNDGVQDSRTYGSWFYVSAQPRAIQTTSNKIFLIGGGLATVG